MAIILSEPLFVLGSMVHATGAALIAIFSWLIGVLLSVFLEKQGQKAPLDALLRCLIHLHKGQDQEKGVCRKYDFNRKTSFLLRDAFAQ